MARRSFLRELWHARNSGCRACTYLDSVDLRIIRGAHCELDGDSSSAVGRGHEGFDDGDKLSSSGREDIVVLQNLSAVDEDVELALSWSSPVGLGEVKIDDVACARGEAGDGVGERAVAIGLVNLQRRGIGYERGVDTGSGRGGCAAGEVFIGYPVANRRSASIDIQHIRGDYAARCGSGGSGVIAGCRGPTA